MIVAQPSERRKGLRRFIRVAGVVVLAAAASVPLAFITAMLLTPVLWRLEPVLGMELAGHSGPAEWIFTTIWVVFTVTLVTLILLVRGRASRREQAGQPVDQGPATMG